LFARVSAHPYLGNAAPLDLRTDIPMEIPQTLRKRLREGKVIPFVGAGVSMAVTERDSGGKRLFPSWNQLLLQAADRLGEEGKAPFADAVRGLVGIGDYLDAAKRARQGLGSTWYDFLKEQFDHHPEQADEVSLSLARGIWRLGSKLVVTTNYDRVLHWAHPHPHNLRLWNIEAPAEQVEMLRGGLRNPTAWHLHGHIDDAASLILTPDGYSGLYSEAVTEAKYEAALRTLHALLTTHVLLFVGYSMDDEQLTKQLERMHEVFEGATGPHYVLVREAEKARVAALGLPVEILTYSDFGQPLLDALSELAEIANEADAPPPPNHGDKPPVIVPGSGSETSAPTPVFFVPFESKGADVVGREAALLAVRKQLSEGRRTQIGQTAAFQGLGGLGKTQLAVEYAYRYRDEYPDGVIWLTADQDIDAQLTEIAPRAGWIAAESEHKYKLDVAMQRLRTHAGLLVFDNVESREVIEPYLPPRETGVHILVTSRVGQAGFRPVPLDLLDMMQSLELLTREAGREPESRAEEEALLEIAERLGGLPLALELAGAFIRHRGIGWGLYRDRLNRDPRAALTGRFLQSSTEHGSDLYSTLQIDEEVFEEEPLLRNILDVLAWSGPAPMGASLLSKMLALEDATDLTEALGLGVALRLLQKTLGTDSYAIHRLVSEVWRQSHPIDERPEWVGKCCSRLGDWFQDRKENFLDLPTFEAEIDHLRAWHEYAVTAAPDDVVRLLWLQAYPPYHRGQFRIAQDYVDRALLAWEAQATGDQELLAHLLHDAGSTTGALGEYQKRLQYDERALAIRIELFGERHPDTAASFDNVAGSYNGLGEYQKDLEYAERALAIRRELFGEMHSDTATSLDSVGITYIYLGNFKKALEYAEHALTIRLELFGDRHPSTAASFQSLGSACGHLGDHKKALEYAERALAIRKELFGERHPLTAFSLAAVAAASSELGEYKKRYEYAERALTTRMELFGERHPETAYSLDDVGKMYVHLGQYNKALEYTGRALAIRKAIFGERHPDTAASLDSVANVYNKLGNYRKDLECAERALQIRTELFGERHLQTAASLNSVGVTFGQVGEHQKALEYIERALVIRKELFGERHPDFAASLASLGTVYSRMREYKKALEYSVRALAIRKDIFGDWHSDVAMSLHNVGNANGNLGDHRRAVANKRQALLINRKVLGESHSQTVQMALSLSATLLHSGEQAEAFDLLYGLSRKLDPSHPGYATVQQYLETLSSKTVRAGFRQPSLSKQSQSAKKSRKKKR
jgi:tetratricopeptide (TPR) repeat protein